MKLSVIGPVFPFKSGIARHTTALVRSARQKPDWDVRVHSFQRQYPAFLYPGKDQKIATADSNEPAECFHIDTMNPLAWKKSVDRIISDKPDAVLITAWTFFLAPALGNIARRIRQSGIHVVLMVHNAIDHDAKWWQHRAMQYQLVSADAHVAHTESVADAIREAGITSQIQVMPHPLYDDFPAASPDPTAQKKNLELLFFGYIRPYKGLEVLLRAIARCERTDLRLTVAGEPWTSAPEIEQLVTNLGIADRVELHLEHVSDQQAADFFGRSDVVVMPYHRATGSGVAAMAQHYEKPILASRVPGLIEATKNEKTGWLFEPGNANQLAELIDASISRETCQAITPELLRQKDALQWSNFVDGIANLIKNIQASRNSNGAA